MSRDMDRPTILVVEEDPEALRAVEEELTDRYARHCDVVCVSAASEAASVLDRRADPAGTGVAGTAPEDVVAGP